MSKDQTRREFLQATGSGAAALIGSLETGLSRVVPLPQAQTQPKSGEPLEHSIVAALGDTLIPSDPGDPGYRDLEKFDITRAVMKELPVKAEQLLAFDNASRSFFDGTGFAALNEAQRERFLYQVIEGTGFEDSQLLQTCRQVYELCRATVFRLFYQNLPENIVRRNSRDVPVPKAGDRHQITNPNTKDVITGWDIANFRGPMGWEEEEQRRARFKKIHWHEDSGDKCKLLE